ncbi:hypothetical protein PAXINDRAFT_140413, partial [Paxillus involutus ATCC 200175]
MPGRTPGGRGRTNFTSEDDDNLAYYLATIYPNKANGGRVGIKAYKDLMDLSDEPDFAWARRHTAHSWRERYKKNQPRLDPLIDDHAEQQKDVGHHFGHDARSRRHRLLWYYKEEEEDEEGEGEEQEHQGR